MTADIKLTPARVAASLAFVTGLLLLCYGGVAFLRLAGTPDSRISALFDMDLEGNIPSWYNSILFLAASLASWMCGRFAAVHDKRQAPHWFVLAAAMLALSIDELLALHELLGQIPFVKTAGVGWTLIVAPVAALFGLWFLPFLLRLPRTVTLCLAAGGIVYVAGAVGMEWIGKNIARTATEVEEITRANWGLVTQNPWYMAEVALEECFEMGGLIVYVFGALSYLKRGGAVMQASFQTGG